MSRSDVAALSGETINVDEEEEEEEGAPVPTADHKPLDGGKKGPDGDGGDDAGPSSEAGVFAQEQLPQVFVG